MKIPVVSSLLSRFQQKADGETELAQNSPHETSTSWNDDSLELNIGTLLADKESKSYGTVQAITLSEFQEELGSLWDQHQKNILLIAETTIDRMLSKGQTAIREDELTWLVVTPMLTISEAEVFVKTIAASIGEKLVGARFEATEADPTPMTGLVDLSEALSEDGSINRGALQNAVSKARAVMAATEARTKREKTRIQTKANKRTHKKASPKEENSDATANTSTSEKGLRLTFWPMWSADSQSIDTFICRPKSDYDGDPLNRENPSVALANSLSVVRGGVAALQGMINNGVRAKLVIPIPLSTLLSPTQRQVLHAFNKLEEAHRFLYLRPEIVCVPHSVSTASILTARDLLRPIARDVGVLTELHNPNAAVFTASKVIIGCDVGHNLYADKSELIARLEKFRRSVTGRPAYAFGLPDLSTLQRAVNIGFDELGGPGFREALNHKPDSTEPLPTQDLMNSGGLYK